MTVSDPERIIAVEGKADLHIIWHLLKINNPEARKIESRNQSLVMRVFGEKNIRIEIYQERGIDQLCNQVSTRIKKSGLESIGFVFDADGDPKGRWKQVRRRILEAYKEVYPADHSTLKKAFYETPVSEGVWVRDCSLKVGVWMMPNNKNAGTIEDFLLIWFLQKTHVGNMQKIMFERSLQKRNIPWGINYFREQKCRKRGSTLG